MTRRYSPAKQLQRDAYLLSRTAGDVAAAQRGVKPLARRVARRTLTRLIFQAFRSNR